MTTLGASSVTIDINDKRQVSGLWQRPRHAKACLVLAHGAGAGMRHPFMAALAQELAEHGIATLRYQFPYVERQSRRPDPASLCHATVRAAVAAATEGAPQIPLFAGGKSFGGRMTSQAQAITPLAEVRGLVFFGFPLHAANRPSDERAAHLSQVNVPMLLLQGSRDSLADLTLLQPLLERLGKRARLIVIPDADHSFHVPARSGRTDEQVRRGMVETAAQWMSHQNVA